MNKFLILIGLLMAINSVGQEPPIDHLESRKPLLEWKEPKVGQSATFPIYDESDKYISFIGPHKYLVEKLADELLKIDSFTFSIEYYCDCRGDSAFNRSYTKRQADSSITWMQKKTGNRLQLTAIGFGEDSLLNDCSCEKRNGEKKDGSFSPCKEEEHQKNRRMVVRIIGLRKD
jgi:hypothetical protein